MTGKSPFSDLYRKGKSILTESEALPEDASPSDALLGLQLPKVLVAGEDEDVDQVHDAVDEGDADVQRQVLAGLDDVRTLLLLKGNQTKQIAIKIKSYHSGA